MKNTLNIMLGLVLAVPLSSAANAETLVLSTGQTTSGNVFHWERETAASRSVNGQSTHAQDMNWVATGWYGDVDDAGYAKAYDANGKATGQNASWLQRLGGMAAHLQKLGNTNLESKYNSKGQLIGHDKHNGMPVTKVKENGNSGSYYSSAADVYMPNSKAYQNGLGMLVRAGSTAKVLTSTTGHYDGSSFGFNARTGNWEGTKSGFDKSGYSSKTNHVSDTGIMDHQSGFYAFTTGFPYNSAQTFSYLNGYISVLGALQGIYLNGKLLDSSYYFMGDNTIDSSYAYMGSWDLELNLDALFKAGILTNGFNNLSFVVDFVPHFITGASTGTLDKDFYAGNRYGDEYGLGAFLADIAMNTESLLHNGNDNKDDNKEEEYYAAVPEPASVFLVGIGIAGLAAARRRKK